MSKLYKPTGMVQLMCADCRRSNVSGEVVSEDDGTEVHAVECDRCGNAGRYIHDTTLGGGDEIEGDFERF